MPEGYWVVRVSVDDNHQAIVGPYFYDDAREVAERLSKEPGWVTIHVSRLATENEARTAMTGWPTLVYPTA